MRHSVMWAIGDILRSEAASSWEEAMRGDSSENILISSYDNCLANR